MKKVSLWKKHVPDELQIRCNQIEKMLDGFGLHWNEKISLLEQVVENIRMVATYEEHDKEHGK
jgi:hypothetical protein